MRELRTCDFCDADPVGVFEPLPPRLVAAQQRVALCADCRDTLQRVLAPLDAADGADSVDTADTTDDANTDATANTSRTDDAAETTGTDDAADDESASTSATAPTSTDDETTVSTPDGVTIGDATAGDEPAAYGPTDDAARGAAAARDEASPDDGTGRVERPTGYGKVIRLVRNRDEALPRGDLEELASSAYDLPADTVHRAVDAAVENGDLQEVDGAIRPR